MPPPNKESVLGTLGIFCVICPNSEGLLAKLQFVSIIYKIKLPGKSDIACSVAFF